MYYYYQCPKCFTEAPIEQRNQHFSGGGAYACDKCHHMFTINDYAPIVKVHKDADYIMNNYKNMRWYHVTLYNEAYFRTGDRNITTHIGTPLTCYDYYAGNNYINTKNLTVLELQLHKDIVVPSTLIHDTNDWCDYEDNIIKGTCDGYLYINRFEAPGSISMITHSDAYEVKDIMSFNDLSHLVPPKDKYLINSK